MLVMIWQASPIDHKVQKRRHIHVGCVVEPPLILSGPWLSIIQHGLSTENWWDFLLLMCRITKNHVLLVTVQNLSLVLIVSADTLTDKDSFSSFILASLC